MLMINNDNVMSEEVNEEKVTEARVISGFPGIGKTRLSKDSRFKTLDAEWSKFSWIGEGADKKRNPDFPTNYIEHVKEHMFSADMILVSSHKEVREALKDANIPYALIYPQKELKDNYIERYKERDNTSKFIEFISNNWDSFIDECDNDDSIKVKLSEGQYLSDLFQKKEELPSSAELLVQLKMYASQEGLEVFIFEGEELKKYFNLKEEGIAVAVIASNKDNAIINLKNETHSWVLKDKE